MNSHLNPNQMLYYSYYDTLTQKSIDYSIPLNNYKPKVVSTKEDTTMELIDRVKLDTYLYNLIKNN